MSALRRMMRRAAGLVAAAGLLSGVAAAAQPSGWSDCDFGDLRVDAGFPAARASACYRQSPEYLSVLVLPEAPGVNPSPWYAFRVTADAPRRIELTLVYGEGRHRYAPKLSQDGRHWEPLPETRVRSIYPGLATLSLDVGPKPLWVAAQELWPAARHEAWLRGLAARPDVTVESLGDSLEGRPIRLLRSDAGEPRARTLVVTGRQHPPEVPGAHGLEAFVETLLEDGELARRFRRDIRIVAVPLLNPDGAEAGHWRLNAGGTDLNRDWGPFAQPETRLMRDLLASIDAEPEGRLAAFVDFHSTQRDVFYTQRDEDPVEPPAFYARWLARLEARMPDSAPARRSGHQEGRPTAKTWVYENYGVPAFSFEIGDATPPEAARRLAGEAARALMETLLEPPAAADVVLPAGDGSFVFDGWAGPPLRVWYHRPEAVGVDTPVLFVLHGVKRDADRYRDQWSALARRLGFVLIVPEFDAARFPGADAYNLGNLMDDAGRVVPPEQRTFTVLEPLFDRVRALTGTRVEGYDLYGHSAGAQFVHRYLLFTRHTRVARAVVANAGWYTMPVDSVDFPYGLAGTDIAASALREALERPVAVLLGTGDTDTQHSSLRRTPEAMAQGPHRLARGEAFFAAGRRAARRAGLAFGWQLVLVDGAVHDNAMMAARAADWLYGR